MIRHNYSDMEQLSRHIQCRKIWSFFRKKAVLLEASDSLYQQTLNKEEKIRRVLHPGNTCKLYEEQHKGQKHQNFLILRRETQVSRGGELVQIIISLFGILYSSDQFPQNITTLVPSFRLEKLRIAYLELQKDAKFELMVSGT